MYQLKTYTTGKFEVYNTRRKKLVYAGNDANFRDKTTEPREFKTVKDLMAGMNSMVSLATFKKMSKVLCAW